MRDRTDQRPIEELLEDERLQSANSRLHPWHVLQRFYYQIIIEHDDRLNSPIRWDPESELSKKALVIDNHEVVSYFKSLAEFQEATLDPDSFRDFSPEKDVAEFEMNPGEYSLVRVSSDGRAAWGAGTDPTGKFFVDIHLNKSTQAEVLEAAVQHIQEIVDRRANEIAGYNARIAILSEQKKQLTSQTS